MPVTDALSAAIVPIDSSRRTYIRFALPIVPTLVGLANHWRARATAEGVSAFGSWHTTNQILRLDCQVWPATNSTGAIGYGLARGARRCCHYRSYVTGGYEHTLRWSPT